MADRHAINNAAINDGSSVVVSAAASFAAAAVISAVAVYHWWGESDVTANAAVESAVWQFHQMPQQGHSATAAVAAAGDVQKWVASDLSATAEISGTALVGLISAVVPGEATGSFTATYKYRTTYSAAADAAFDVSATPGDVYRNLYGVVVADGLLTPGEFIADPKLKLNGESTYTHDGAVFMDAAAGVSFIADWVRIFPDGWYPFGGAEFDATAHLGIPRSAWLYSSATATATAKNYAAGAGSATSSAAIVESSYAFRPAAATLSGTAAIVSQAKINYKVSKVLTAYATSTATGYRVVFHGYPVLSAVAQVEASALMVLAGASNLSCTAEFAGRGVLNTRDAVILYRSPQPKDFVRAAIVRDFTRLAT